MCSFAHMQNMFFLLHMTEQGGKPTKCDYFWRNLILQHAKPQSTMTATFGDTNISDCYCAKPILYFIVRILHTQTLLLNLCFTLLAEIERQFVHSKNKYSMYRRREKPPEGLVNHGWSVLLSFKPLFEIIHVLFQTNSLSTLLRLI